MKELEAIKCRALDNQGNWHYGAYIHDSVHKKHFIISVGMHGLTERAIRPETVGEYAGFIYDKDLFAGDILSWTDSEGYGFEEVEYSGIFIVKWSETDLRYDLFDPFAGEWWPLNDTNFNSKIGNIYENQDLLGEVSDAN